MVLQMTNMSNTSSVAKMLSVNKVTVNRLVAKDESFPRPKRIGREDYFSDEKLHLWVQSRVCNQAEFKYDDVIISGRKFLEDIGRSKGWLWLNVIKPNKLARINLSPDPSSNKLINNFIEREIYEAFGELFSKSKGQSSDGVIARHLAKESEDSKANHVKKYLLIVCDKSSDFSVNDLANIDSIKLEVRKL